MIKRNRANVIPAFNFSDAETNTLKYASAFQIGFLFFIYISSNNINLLTNTSKWHNGFILLLNIFFQIGTHFLNFKELVSIGFFYSLIFYIMIFHLIKNNLNTFYSFEKFN